jgi:putative transcriptional regulator
MRRAARRESANGRTRIGAGRAELATEERRSVAADPDARPITEDDLIAGRVRLVPPVRTLRHRLQLSQEEFAARYHIPVGTLRDWEQRRKEPDAAAKAYLRVIALEPEVVRKALAARPPRSKPRPR